MAATTGTVRLTDAGGTDVDDYQAGDTVAIEVSDPDENADPAVADHLSVGAGELGDR